MPRYIQEAIETRRVKTIRLAEADTQAQAKQLFASGEKTLPVSEETLETIAIEYANVTESSLGPRIARVARLRVALGPKMTTDMNALVDYLEPLLFADDANGRPFEGREDGQAILQAFGLLADLAENLDTDRRYESENTNCACCGKDTQKIGEYYDVKDAIWQEAGKHFAEKVLCVGCLEEKLGRPLVPEDFSNAPVNLNLARKSARLRQRMGK
jgi:hypothetical protein